ncbi:MAG: hypothetical protein IT210_20010 [Armatimonadetes bacterium]|nr:hypothetical protein [Armatimonadota bacterium]
MKEYGGIVGNRGVVMLCIRSPLNHNAGAARDMQDLMADYYTDRPLFDALLSLFFERMMAQTKNALEGGAEWIFGSWYFHSLSSGWSPRIFEEAFAPWIRAHVDLVHSYGAYYDYYDDGKLNDTMEIIAGTGVDVLGTCTPPPVGDFDLKAVKARIGSQVALKGYIDLLYVMQRGTPQQVEITVREAMEIAGPGGGWIIGTSDSFRENTPDENMAAYWNACLKNGDYRQR